MEPARQPKPEPPMETTDRRGSSPDTLVPAELNAAGYPRIPLNLRDHKLSIGITWSLLLIFNFLLPDGLYFALKYSAHTSQTVYLAVPTAVFGAFASIGMGQRLMRLLQKDPHFRPLQNSPRAAMDYFQWNFIFGFVYITVLISVGNAIKSLRMLSMPLTCLMFQVCLQILLIQPFVGRARYPFRISSLVKGDLLRPAIYTIVEDICAVDGNEGLNFREPFTRRYEASPYIRSAIDKLSWLWGVSGICLVAANLAMIWAINCEDASYAIGWTTPGIWGIVMAFISWRMVHAALVAESRNAPGTKEAGLGVGAIAA